MRRFLFLGILVLACSHAATRPGEERQALLARRPPLSSPLGEARDRMVSFAWFLHESWVEPLPLRVPLRMTVDALNERLGLGRLDPETTQDDALGELEHALLALSAREPDVTANRLVQIGVRGMAERLGDGTAYFTWEELRQPEFQWRSLPVDCRILGGDVLYVKPGNDQNGLEGSARRAPTARARVILDLRGQNRGDELEILDLFVSSGELGSVLRRPKPETYEAKPGGVFEESRVVVLVDRVTMGGAELIAGSLQDHGATVLGRRTRGSGTLYDLQQMTPGVDLILYPLARLRRPGQKPIAGVGVVPDEFFDESPIPRASVSEVTCDGVEPERSLRTDALVVRGVRLLQSK